MKISQSTKNLISARQTTNQYQCTKAVKQLRYWLHCNWFTQTSWTVL